MKTVVLGSGSWGTALAQVLCDNGMDVILWGRKREVVDEINHVHRNSRYFDTVLNEKLQATDDLDEVSDADVVLLAVPTTAMENVLRQACERITRRVIFINTAKGFHPVSHKRMSVVIKETVPEEKLKAVVSLIGPSHAEEAVERKLTCVSAVSEDEYAAHIVQNLFSNGYFRVYRNTDVAGAETGVALKNVIAIASGILEGIGQGDNAKAALMTRGLAEITRYGTALGGKRETYLGLDGVGDLIVTCTSRHSRNFMAGYQIGKDGGAERFMKENTKTVEGINACRIVHEDAKRLGVDMPITDQVYAVLFEGKDPRSAVNDLMERELKSEEKM